MEDNTRYIVSKSFRRMLPRVLTSGMMMISAQILGTLFVAYYLGSEAMSITLLSLPMWSVAYILFTGFGYGASTLFTQHMGENDKPGATAIVNDSLSAMSIVTVIFTIGGWIFSGPITTAMGTTPELYDAAVEYNKWLAVAMGFSIFSALFYFVVNADNRPTMALIGSCIKTAVFVLFCMLFMGVWDGDVTTSVYALIIAELASTAFLLSHFFSRQCNVKLRFKIPSLYNLKRLGGYLLNFFADNISFIIVVLVLNNLLLDKFPIEIVAIYLMLISANDVALTLFSTTSYSMMPIIGTFYGEKNGNAIRETLSIGMKTGMKISIVMVVVTLIASPWIPSLYSYEYKDYMPEAIWAVILFALSFPFTMATNIAINFFLSINKMKIGMVLALADTLFIPLSMGLIAVATRNPLFLWLLFIASGLVPSLMLGIYVYRKMRLKSFDVFLGFPEKSKIFKANLYFLILPDNTKDLDDYQEMTILFLAKHKVSDNRAYRCKQLVGEVMEYALASNQKKDSYIDIQIAILATEEIRIMVKLDNDIVDMESTPDERLLSLVFLKTLSKEFKYNRILSFNTIDMTL